MVKDPVAARYASALFELAKNERRIDEVSQELKELAELIQHHEDLRKFLVNPDVEVRDKLGVLGRLLGGAWSQATKAFVQVVLSLGRAEYLVGMAEAFGELVDAEHRLMHVLVRCAHPLARSLKTLLTQKLERLERCTIQLTEEIAPDLLGGIQVFMGHRIIDGSLKTKLGELRHRLKAVRVH